MRKESANGIEITNLSHAFAGRTVLSNIDMSVPDGSSVALLGPNGAGKTTLMNVLCALLTPDSGRVMLAILRASLTPCGARLAPSFRPQPRHPPDRLENLEFHGLILTFAGAGAESRRGSRLVELDEWRDEIVRTFSGGMGGARDRAGPDAPAQHLFS